MDKYNAVAAIAIAELDLKPWGLLYLRGRVDGETELRFLAVIDGQAFQ